MKSFQNLETNLTITTKFHKHNTNIMFSDTIECNRQKIAIFMLTRKGSQLTYYFN